jgi:peroxiredoxin Q/BCP
MRPIHALAAVAAVAALAGTAYANLAPGAAAPMFTAKGAVAGKPITFTLATQLKKGPVVVYFFPAAFTGGCNAEANAFAEAMPDFRKAGATVVGLTAGNVDQLAKFSSEHCAGKFPVAVATPDIIAGYDVRLMDKEGRPTNLTSRTSYVIAPDGKVLFTHTDMKPAEHISGTLAAVRKYHADKPKRR